MTRIFGESVAIDSFLDDMEKDIFDKPMTLKHSPESEKEEKFGAIQVNGVTRFALNVSLIPEEGQMLLLAIANLAIKHPGWDMSLRALALKLDGIETFEAQKKIIQEVAAEIDVVDELKKLG